MNLIAIALVLAGLAVATALRSILAQPAPKRIHVRSIAHIVPPEPLLPPVQAAHASLSALGFAHLGWILIRAEPENVPVARLVRLYVNGDRRTIAQVLTPFTLDAADRCRVHFISQLQDGRLAFTAPWMPETLAAIPHLAVTQMDGYPTLEAQFTAHGDLIAAQGSPRPWNDHEAAIARLQEYEQRVWGEAQARGHLLPHADGSLRLSIRRAFATLASLFRRPAPAKAEQTPVSDALAALCWLNWKATQTHAPRPQVQVGLFSISALLFLAAASGLWSAEMGLILFGVIVLHETGHWLAMRALGYVNTQIMMLPMIGGVTIGHEQTPSARDRAIVTLMGPLPGILLGASLLLGELTHLHPWAYLTAILLLAINLFNLLPILPLDGGQLLRNLLPRHAFTAQTVLSATAIVLLTTIAWFLSEWLLLLFAIIPFVELRQSRNMRRWLGAFLRAAPAAPSSREDEIARIFALIRADQPANANLTTLAPAVDQLLTLANTLPMSATARASITAAWVGCCWLAYVSIRTAMLT